MTIDTSRFPVSDILSPMLDDIILIEDIALEPDTPIYLRPEWHNSQEMYFMDILLNDSSRTYKIFQRGLSWMIALRSGQEAVILRTGTCIGKYTRFETLTDRVDYSIKKVEHCEYGSGSAKIIYLTGTDYAILRTHNSEMEVSGMNVLAYGTATDDNDAIFTVVNSLNVCDVLPDSTRFFIITSIQFDPDKTLRSDIIDTEDLFISRHVIDNAEATDIDDLDAVKGVLDKHYHSKPGGSLDLCGVDAEYNQSDYIDYITELYDIKLDQAIMASYAFKKAEHAENPGPFVSYSEYREIVDKEANIKYEEAHDYPHKMYLLFMRHEEYMDALEYLYYNY